MGKTIRLTESKLNEMIASIVEEILYGDADDSEITFGDDNELRPGLHQQEVYYKNKFVGFLRTRDKNRIASPEEYYHIPDVDKGLDGQGFINVKIFKDDEDAAVAYIKQNFDQIVYLANNGSWD